MPNHHFKHSRSWRDGSSPKRGAKKFKPKKSTRSAGKPLPKIKIPSFKINKEFFRNAFPFVLILMALGVLTVVSAFAWYSRDLPRPDKIIDRSIAQSTKIYDRTGEHLLFEVHGVERRTIIPLEQIPEYAKWATVLVEDKNFYTHSGFDLRGIARALYKDITSLSAAEGGSTLTQQLIKNALLSNEKRISRKIKEFVLAYQIERKFSKDQILQLYFNEIPYGSNAYGIQAASQFYFNKDAQDITIAEAATLAALPRAPTFYSPFGAHVDALMARKDFIIDLLEKAEIINEDEAIEAKEQELEFVARSSIRAPHFVIMVREALAQEYGEREVEQGGLKVITSLDWEMQQKAEAAIEEFAEENKETLNATNASLVAIDPKTGQILAMVGSIDYFDIDNQGNFNVAVQGKRQPGSSLKPLVYATGFEEGYTDKTTLWDVVTNFGADGQGNTYEPKNYDLEEHGPVTIRTALSTSLNIPAVKMLYLLGVDKVIKKAQDFGYTTFTDPSRYGLSLVLGGAEVTLLEHTAAYAAYADQGVRRPTVSVLRVENNKGQVLQEYEENDGERVLDRESANLLTNILSDNESRAPAFGVNNHLTLGERPVAGKTGTTNDYRDAWMMGYTPSLAAGVWVGNNDFSEMVRGAGGSRAAAPIWNKFMRDALSGTPVENFPEVEIEYPEKSVLRGDFSGGTPIKIDRASGLLATEFTPESFIVERVFKTGHNILHYVNPDDPLGPAPIGSTRDHQYNEWEKSVQAWMSKNGWNASEGSIPTEYDNIHLPEFKPSISIIEPIDGATVSGDVIEFRVEASAPRGISRVEFYVDGEFINESRVFPYTGRYLPDTRIPNGFHTMTAVAYDDIDNFQSAQINFNLFIDKGSE